MTANRRLKTLLTLRKQILFTILISLSFFISLSPLPHILEKRPANINNQNLKSSATEFTLNTDGFDHLNNNGHKLLVFLRRSPYHFEWYQFTDDPDHYLYLDFEPDLLIVVTTDDDKNNDWDHWTIDWLEWQYTGSTTKRDNTGIDFGYPGEDHSNKYHTINQGIVVYNLRGSGDNLELSRLCSDTQDYIDKFDFWSGLNPYFADGYSGNRVEMYMKGDVLAHVAVPYLCQPFAHPPDTTIVPLDPINGENGWYKSSPRIELTRVDQDTIGMSSGYAGVAYTLYSYDHSNWNTYTAPLYPTIQGQVSFWAYSVDNMGNTEWVTEFINFKLDTVAPSTSINVVGDPGLGNWYISNVTVELTASDATSLVDYTEYNINNDGWQRYQGIFPLEAELNTTQTFEVQYRSKDNAGLFENIKNEEIIIDTSTKDVRWATPNDGSEVIFEIMSNQFNFTYNYKDLENVELYLNNTFIDDVWSYPGIHTKQVSIDLPFYDDRIDKEVIGLLIGYKGGVEVVRDTRNFFFSKKIDDQPELIESNTTYVAEQLYFILHDPSWDDSYSSFESGSTMSMSVGLEVTDGTIENLEVGVDFSLMGVGGSASTSIEHKATTMEGFDFKYEVSSMNYYTSSKEPNNPDLIGPGYGDIYWGEAWVYKWQLIAHNVTYYNGTSRYEEPEIKYGINRTAEVGLNEHSGTVPQEWIDMNPVHNGYSDVSFFRHHHITGGPVRGYSDTITNTISRSNFFEIEVTKAAQAKLKLPIFTAGGKLTITTTKKNFQDVSEGHYVKTSYYLHDTEGTDTIDTDVGFDPIFGTYVFKPNYFETETSYPLEHGTSDYISPVVSIPTIDYNDEVEGPYLDDIPTVTTTIFDESGVSRAIIWYRANGVIQTPVNLSEQSGNPGTWEGNIPSYPQGTNISWHVEVWDNALLKTIRKNEYDKTFWYIVLNREPTVLLSSPNGGEILQGSFLINWTCADPDNDELSFTLAYNLDNTGWHLLASDVKGSTYLWDVSKVPNSYSVQLRITVDDGCGGTNIDESDYVFTIENPPNTTTAISIGHYYLPFLLIAIISLVIVINRKLILKR